MNVQIPGQFPKSSKSGSGRAQNKNHNKTLCVGSPNKHGYLMVDLLVALAILSLAIVPVGFSFARERQVLKIEYFRSVANEIVDGEMEILAAGDWKNFPDGSLDYPVHAQAAATLPPGHFQLTKTGNHLRLEWNSDEKHGVGAVVRKVTIK
jgi:hypothetical protein